jgi:hypothetical protein
MEEKDNLNIGSVENSTDIYRMDSKYSSAFTKENNPYYTGI